MKQENKNKVGIALMLIAIVLFAGGITFAFFRAGVTGEQEKLTVTTGTLALTFADNNTGITATELQLGEETSKEFSIKNTGTLDVTTNMLWNNLINTYLKQSMSYTFQYKTTEGGEWETTPLASGNIPRSATPQDFTLAENITIPVGATYYYKLTIRFNALEDVNQTSDKDAVLTSNFKLGNAVVLSDVDKTLVALGALKKEGTPDFTAVATTDETSDGLYSMADDYGTSYYYRGAVTNNYVKFAGFYWRIIRVNGDGSIRMIYDGTVAHNNGESSTDRLSHTGKAFNAKYDDAKYVGWMYGGASGVASTSKEDAQKNETNSDMKNLVNTWYDEKLSSYDQYIADAVYCADRTIPGKSVTEWSSDTGLGYAKNATAYGAVGRLVNASTWHGPKANAQPAFTCPQKNDAFTVSDSVHGNAIGTSKSRKIGLITADEIVAAGGRYYDDNNSSNNSSYYLYKGSWYWSLSPYDFSGSYATVFRVYADGYLYGNGVNDASGAVAPVISLKAEYASQLTGSGTASSPYQISGLA